MLTTLLLSASSYDIKTSFMGKVGEVHLDSYEDGKTYSITADIKATGIAKTLSKRLHYIHKSSGFIKNGEYYATRYSVEQSRGSRRSLKVYRFDYKHKIVTKNYKRWKHGKLTTNKTVTLGYFTHIDGLNVYPYIMKFKKTHPAGTYTLTSAGAERFGGNVDFTIADNQTARAQLHRLGQKTGYIVQIFASKDFFVGGRGTLTFAIDTHDVTKVVELTEVKKAGTIKGVKVD